MAEKAVARPVAIDPDPGSFARTIRSPSPRPKLLLAGEMMRPVTEQTATRVLPDSAQKHDIRVAGVS